MTGLMGEHCSGSASEMVPPETEQRELVPVKVRLVTTSNPSDLISFATSAPAQREQVACQRQLRFRKSAQSTRQTRHDQ